MARIIAILLFSTIIFCIQSTSVFADLNRSQIIGEFKKAASLNEEYKKTDFPSLLTMQKKREEMESYEENVLTPALNSCSKILSSKHDIELAIELYKVIISYEDSADETFSDTLGEIFLNNSSLVIEALNKFSFEDQKFIYKKLEFGWLNVTFDKDKSDPKIISRSKLLKEIGDKILK